MSMSSIGVEPVSRAVDVARRGEREPGQAGGGRAEEEHPGDGIRGRQVRLADVLQEDGRKSPSGSRPPR